MYKWKGAIEEDSESLLVVKTVDGNEAAVTELVQSIHPYENPEVLFLPVAAGSEPYLAWLEKVTKRA